MKYCAKYINRYTKEERRGEEHYHFFLHSDSVSPRYGKHAMLWHDKPTNQPTNFKR